MSADAPLAREVAARQVAMFAMFVGRGLYTTRAALSRASGLPDSTLKDWAGGAAMPFHGVLTLRRYLPPEAINMMAEPGDARLVDAERAETSWDKLACGTARLAADICEARGDGVISHTERARLRKRAREVIAEAEAMVGDG